MMTRNGFSAAFLILVASLGSVPLRAQEPAKPRQMSLAQLDEASNNATFNAYVGQLFELVLAENGTTGFTWNGLALSESVLKTVEERTEPGQRIGQGGFRYFLFRASGEGDAQIRLNYSRSFESVPPLQVFTLKIHIAPLSAGETPVVTSFSTATTRAGSDVLVKGANFVPSLSTVLLDQKPVSSIFLSPENGFFLIPADTPEGAHMLAVMTGDKTSGETPITVSKAAPDVDPFNPGLRGDLNGDGQVTIQDVIQVLRQAVGLE